MESQNIKLTPKQNQVIYHLQNGWELITSNETTGAWVAKKDQQYKINGGIFWKLYAMKLIFQDGMRHHGYYLTPMGEKIKTKPVTIK